MSNVNLHEILSTLFPGKSTSGTTYLHYNRPYCRKTYQYEGVPDPVFIFLSQCIYELYLYSDAQVEDEDAETEADELEADDSSSEGSDLEFSETS